MKLITRTIAITVSLLTLMSLSSCDMFRKLAGRPTAEELELMSLEKLKLEEARYQASVDSLKIVRKAMEDSIAVLDSIRQIGGTVLNPSDIGGLFTTRLDFNYYVVVGSFRSRSNAEKLFQMVSDRGYRPVLISFRNGFNAIAIAPSNDLHGILDSLRRIKGETFCPDDVWVLVNE